MQIIPESHQLVVVTRLNVIQNPNWWRRRICRKRKLWACDIQCSSVSDMSGSESVERFGSSFALKQTMPFYAETVK
jgi:hypothetical protein